MTTSEKRGAPETPRAIDSTDRAILNALSEEQGRNVYWVAGQVPDHIGPQHHFAQWVTSRTLLLEKAGLVKREQGKTILLWLRTAAGTEALGTSS